MSRSSRRLSLRFLLEQEEEEGEGEDLFGAEEESPETPGDVEADADTEAADDAGDTETEAEEEVDIDPGDEVELRKPLEAQVDNMLADFEMAALKSSVINVDEETVEESWWRQPLTTLLVEVDDAAELDVELFAADVARLIQNYETLLDIESAIYYRAIALLERNYDEALAAAFRDIMQSRYQFDFDDIREDPVAAEAPLALGAGAAEGGGGV